MSGNNSNGATTEDYARIIGYVNQIKEEFCDQPQILQDFVDILTAYHTERISIRTAIRRVSILFRGNQRLIHGFKAFVPEGYDHEFPTISGGSSSGGGGGGSTNAVSTTITSSSMRTSTSTTTRRRHHSNVATTTTSSVTQRHQQLQQQQQQQLLQQQQQQQLQLQQQQLQQQQKKKQQQPVAAIVQGPSLDDLKYDTPVQACVICLENAPICTAIPCMHMSYCVKCAYTLCYGNGTTEKKKKHYIGEIKCCVCRQPIHAMKRVHQS